MANFRETIRKAIKELRQDSDYKPDPSHAVRECKNCGYTGEFGLLECTCMENVCTLENPDPKCPNGIPVCPVCHEGIIWSNPHIGLRDGLMILEKALKEVEINE